jgi:O-antigen/teichoic acid export membrane protein
MKISGGDVIWNYIGTFMAMGANLLLLPFFIYFLTGDSLGLWFVFASVGGLVTLFDFGFSPTLARNVAYTWGGAKSLIHNDVIHSNNNEPNYLLLKKVLITSKFIYLLISLLALLILLSIGTYYIYVVSGEISGYSHIFAWLIYCVAIFMNLYYGFYITFLRGVGAIKQVNIATVFSRIFQILSSIIFLFLGFGILGIAISYLLYGLTFRSISKRLFLKFQNIGFKLNLITSKVDKSEILILFRVIWHNAWKDGLVSLSRFLSNQATVLISSIYFTLIETGYYSISIQLVAAISTLSTTVYSVFQPSFQALHITGDQEKIRKLMSISVVTYLLSFIIGLFALVLIGFPILSYIRPTFKVDLLIFTSITIYDFLLKHQFLFASFISNTNKVPYMPSFILSSLFGIILSIILLETTNFGLWALIISQIVSQLIYNNWKWTSVVLKSLDITYTKLLCLGFNHIFSFLKMKLKMV